MSLEATLATWELSKKQVSSHEKYLLLSLARRAGEDHTCWPSVRRMCEDTGLDRKTIISIRQTLLDRSIIKYTGEMKGRSGQVPVMQLPYVYEWEQKRNSPRLKDHEDLHAVTSPKNGTGKTSTSPKTGTGTSTEIGTGTSPKNGTLNIKGEYKRGNKSSCASLPKSQGQKAKTPKALDQNPSKRNNKSKSKTREDWKAENEQKHGWHAKAKVCEPVTDDPVICHGCQRPDSHCTCGKPQERCSKNTMAAFARAAMSIAMGRKVDINETSRKIREASDAGKKEIYRTGQDKPAEQHQDCAGGS